MANSNLIKHFTDNDFDAQIMDGLVLVDFHANWCGPCRMLAPVLEEVAQAMQGQAVIGKVDIDHAQNVAARFQIASVPTMILFKNGQEVSRLVGLRNADGIKEFILAGM